MHQVATWPPDKNLITEDNFDQVPEARSHWKLFLMLEFFEGFWLIYELEIDKTMNPING